MRQYFSLELGRTQYVIYYIFGAAIALVAGVIGATVVLLSLHLGGTVMGLRSLLRALGRDERLCLLVLPLLVSEMFAYGSFRSSWAVPGLKGEPLINVRGAIAAHRCGLRIIAFMLSSA